MTEEISFSNSDWHDRLSQIIPQKGFCIFIDIVGSTQLKELPFAKWLAFIHNNIVQAVSNFLHFNTFYKIIGDCVMIWINEEKMKQHGENELTIFDFLKNIAKENDEQYFRHVKISITYCTSIYEITFVPNTDDAYGQEIDLCSRLNSLAKETEILMNEPFYYRLKERYEQIGNKQQFPEVIQIQGPKRKKIKGMNKMVKFYKLP